MTVQTEHDLKAGRRRVARSRGVLSGVLLIVLGAWAALVPFIGPYFDFGTPPNPDDAWHWTSGRGLFELLPGAVAVLAGIVLLLSASRALTVAFAWIAAAAGAWLVIAPSIAPVLNVALGDAGRIFDPSLGERGRAAEELLYFFAIGGAILLVAGLAIGRLSVHSVRDVKAAERRAEADAAAAADTATTADRDAGRTTDTTAFPPVGRHDDTAGRHTEVQPEPQPGAVPPEPRPGAAPVAQPGATPPPPRWGEPPTHPQQQPPAQPGPYDPPAR